MKTRPKPNQFSASRHPLSFLWLSVAVLPVWLPAAEEINPTVLGSYVLRNEAFDVAIGDNGEFAYVAAGKSGLQVVDIQDSRNPKLVATVNTEGSAIAVAVSGNTVYLADAEIVVTNQMSLVRAAVSDVSEVPTLATNAVVIADIEDGIYVRVFDEFGDVVAEGASWEIGGERQWQVDQLKEQLEFHSQNGDQFPDWRMDELTRQAAQLVDYQHTQISWRVGGSVKRINIHDPKYPHLVREFDVLGSPRDVEAAGDHVYVVSTDPGDPWGEVTPKGRLQVFDVSDGSESWKQVAEFRTQASPSDVAVVGNRAYLADSNVLRHAGCGNFVVGQQGEGLIVLDVSEPADIKRLGRVEIRNGTGHRGGFGLLRAPRCHGGARAATGATAVSVAGDYAYVTSETQGFQIINVSDPANMAEVGSYDSADLHKVGVQASTAYIAGGTDGVQAIDVRGPHPPHAHWTAEVGLLRRITGHRWRPSNRLEFAVREPWWGKHAPWRCRFDASSDATEHCCAIDRRG